jgi:general secretion pathway protein F
VKTFSYRGYEASGRSTRGLVEALDLKDAREKLSGQGVFPERVVPAGNETTGSWGRKPASFSLDARSMIYRELSALLGAGIPLSQALEILIDSPELGGSGAALAGVRDRVRDGDSLAEALTSASPRVTAFEEAVVAVGERAGELEESLNRLGSFLEQQRAMRENVGTALIYPVIVVVLALLIGVGVLGIMVPRIGAMLTENNVPLPLLTQIMMGVGTLVSKFLVPGLLVAGVGGYLFFRQLPRDAGLWLRWQKLCFSIPFAGRAYAALVNIRFARTLALLIRGGVPLVESLGLAGRATGSGWVERLVREESEAVRQGGRLADSVRRIPPLRTSLPGWIEAGEASGDLVGMLECAAERHQHQWDRLVARFLALLEPILVILVGGFVLLVALSILLPILSMNKQIL